MRLISLIVKIRDCIVPRTEVVAVGWIASLEDLKNVFVESGISKIIVYDGNIDNVIGYIHSSEMFRNPADWRNNVKEVPIVPETMAAHKLMKLFMQQKKTIAVVVDEFGGTSGYCFTLKIWLKKYSGILRTSTTTLPISVNKLANMNMYCPHVLK